METYNIFAKFYDAFTYDVDYEKRAEYFHQLIKSHVGGQKLLLDLACGTGNLSVFLSKLGYDVIGVDASVDMLFVAQEKAREASQNILFLNQTMEELDLYGTINGCVCALDSLNHITDERNLKKAFQRVSLFLEKGGAFVFDVNTPFKHTDVLADNNFVYELDNVVCVWQNSTEGLTTTINLDFFEENEDGTYNRYSENFCERGYSEATIRNLLVDVGFRIEGVFADDSKDPPTETTQRWVFLCVKEK